MTHLTITDASYYVHEDLVELRVDLTAYDESASPTDTPQTVTNKVLIPRTTLISLMNSVSRAAPIVDIRLPALEGASWILP